MRQKRQLAGMVQASDVTNSALTKARAARAMPGARRELHGQFTCYSYVV